MGRRKTRTTSYALALVASVSLVTILIYDASVVGVTPSPLLWSLYLLPIAVAAYVWGRKIGLLVAGASLILLSPMLVSVFLRFGISQVTMAETALVVLFCSFPILVDSIASSQRQQTELTHALSHLQRLLEERLALDKLLPGLLGEAIDRCQAQCGVVYLLDRRTGSFELAASLGLESTSGAGSLQSAMASKAMKLWATSASTALVAGSTRQLPPALAEAVAQEEGTASFRPRSLVSVPLRGADGYFGLIVLLDAAEGAFDQQHLEILESMAEMSQTAVEQARLHAELRRTASELRMLNELSRAATASLDLKETIESIIASLQRAFPQYSIDLFHWDDELGRLVLWARGDRQRIEYLDVGEDLEWRYAQMVAAARRAQRADDLQERGLTPSMQTASGERYDYRYDVWAAIMGKPPSAWASSGEEHAHSYDIPLVVGQKAVGTLCFHSREPQGFGSSERQVLRAVAAQVAVAVSNASLHGKTDRELSRKLAEISTLQALAKQFNATLDLHRVLDLVLGQCLELTGADVGVIALWDEARQDLRPALVRDRAGNLTADQPPRVAEECLRRVIGSGEQLLEVGCPTVADGSTLQARLGVAIRRGPQMVGGIYLEASRPDAFSPADLGFISHVAEHAAIALENAQLFKVVQEDRQRIQHILQGIADGVFATDRERRVLSFNPAAERITGWKQREVVGRFCCEVMRPPTDGPVASCPADCPLRQAMDQGTAVQVGPVVWGASGRLSAKLQVSCSVAPLRAGDGEIVGTVAVFRDVSREAELDQLKSDFVSMVSHEIRSPLASITVAAEVLRRGRGGERSGELLDTIRAQSLQLANFVEDVLNASRLDKGLLEMHVEPLPIVPLLKRAIALTQATTSRHNLQLRADSEGLFVLADARKIEVVVGNLLRNAVNYSPNGGTVTVEVREQGEETVVSVRDEGIGIPANHLERIFDRFTRVDDGDAKTVYGHGLGLYIARSIVQRHGGRIWVDSEVGKGSCFSFTLRTLKARAGRKRRGERAQ